MSGHGGVRGGVRGFVGTEAAAELALHGYAAFEQGVPLLENPHIESNERAALQWDAGWLEAAKAASDLVRRFKPLIEGRAHIRELLQVFAIMVQRELSKHKIGFQEQKHLWDVRDRAEKALQLVGETT